MIAVGEADGGFFKVGFVHEFLRCGCGFGRWCRTRVKRCQYVLPRRLPRMVASVPPNLPIAMLSSSKRGLTAGAAPMGAARLTGAVGAKARAAASSSPRKSAGWVGASPLALLFHHCCDICASISSIFLSVTARSSGEAMLLWKNEGRAVGSSVRWPCSTSRWRSLRSWSNSRRRTKSLRRLRSIISLSICLLYWLSRSSWSESSSVQFVVGLRTNRTILDSRPPGVVSSLLMG